MVVDVFGKIPARVLLHGAVVERNGFERRNFVRLGVQYIQHGDQDLVHGINLPVDDKSYAQLLRRKITQGGNKTINAPGMPLTHELIIRSLL